MKNILCLCVGWLDIKMPTLLPILSYTLNTIPNQTATGFLCRNWQTDCKIDMEMQLT
jgi:hypothetical protein